MSADMDFVKALARYVDTGQVSSKSMRDAKESIGEYRLRVLCITLLEWMKSQHRTGKPRPLQLNKEYTWCEDLRQLMGCTSLFDDVLEIQDHSLDFATALMEESRAELCTAADQSYSPTLRT
jgi:hypothetical protein